MTTNAHNISETDNAVDMNDPQTRRFVGEFLDARRDGLLRDWTPSQYVKRRQRDEKNKELGGLAAGNDDDDFSERDI